MSEIKGILGSMVALLLNMAFWKNIGFVLAPILTAVMIFYYMSLWYWKLKEKRNKSEKALNQKINQKSNKSIDK